MACVRSVELVILLCWKKRRYLLAFGIVWIWKPGSEDVMSNYVRVNQRAYISVGIYHMTIARDFKLNG